MKKIIGITFVVFLLLITSYANSAKTNIKNLETHDLDTSETQYWTIMIYLDGDNNLQSYLEKTIRRIELNGYNDHVNIVAQFDSFDLFDGVRRYALTENGSELVEVLEEKSMGDEETLVNFVAWAKNNYPAEKYCLVLTDHGVGWRNGFLRDETDMVDDKPDYISMAELKSSMNRIKKDVLGNNKLDLLVIDACQMSMIEVYYQIRDTTKICLASPDLTTGGSPYHWILDDLYENVDCNESVLAEYFYQANKKYYDDVELGVYDVEKITTDVVDALDDFSDALLNNYKRCRNEIKRALRDTKKYDGVGGYVTHYRDLYDFADEISEITSVEDIKIKAEELKNDLMNSKICPSGTDGMSIYLPVFNLIYEYEPSYSDMDLCKDTNWYDFVLKTRYITVVNSYAAKIFIENQNSLLMMFLYQLMKNHKSLFLKNLV